MNQETRKLYGGSNHTVSQTTGYKGSLTLIAPILYGTQNLKGSDGPFLISSYSTNSAEGTALKVKR